MSKTPRERAHNKDAEFTHEGTEGGAQSTVDQLVDLADKAVTEAVRLGKTAMEPDNTPKVAAGATIGALAGMAIPLVSWPLAAIAGAGYVAYQAAKKANDAD
jgi:hypothetical protein